MINRRTFSNKFSIKENSLIVLLTKSVAHLDESFSRPMTCAVFARYLKGHLFLNILNSCMYSQFSYDLCCYARAMVSVTAG